MAPAGSGRGGSDGSDGPDEAGGADAAERARRRAAIFGDDAPAVSADERDDADRARGTGGHDRRWYDEQRPPHHDRA